MFKFITRWWRNRNAKQPQLPPHELERLSARVGALAKDDPLWPMLLALLRENLKTEIDAVAKPDIEDAEAHRSRGRLGMLLDLESQFGKLWQDTHQGQ